MGSRKMRTGAPWSDSINRNAVWTWTELTRAVDDCKTGTAVDDATYAVPCEDFTPSGREERLTIPIPLRRPSAHRLDHPSICLAGG
jgi:hypothetical protein